MSSWSRPCGPRVACRVTVSPVPLVGPAGRAQDALLDGRDPGRVCANLADDAGPHAAAVDAFGDVGDHLVGDLVGFPAVEIGLVVRLAIPATAENDLDPGPFGDALDGQRVLGQTAIGLIDQGHAAGIFVALQLERRQIGVIQDVVADPGVAHEVQQQVLVDEGEAELIGGTRPADGHDGRGHRHDPARRGESSARSSGYSMSPPRLVLGRQGEDVYTISRRLCQTNDRCTHRPGQRARAAPRYCRRAARRIINGRLEPGERVLEVELARRFGVSRQPVREAIRTLEREGLLTSLPNRGTFVTRVSLDDAIAIQDIRAQLEGLAARLAVEHLTHSRLQAPA